MGKGCDFFILLRQTFLSIYHQKNDFCIFQSFDCPVHGIVLYIFLHSGFTPYTCRIQNLKSPSAILKRPLHYISGGTGIITYDRSLGMGQSVSQGGFSRIGFSHNGNSYRDNILAFFYFGKIKLFYKQVRQFWNTIPVFCRNQQQIVKAKLHVVPSFFFQPATFCLIHRSYNFMPIRTQKFDKFFIFSRYQSCIQQKQNHVGIFQSF